MCVLVVVREYLFCGEVLSAVSSFAIFLLRKDELVSLLRSCSCWCGFQCSVSLPRGEGFLSIFLSIFTAHGHI